MAKNLRKKATGSSNFGNIWPWDLSAHKEHEFVEEAHLLVHISEFRQHPPRRENSKEPHGELWSPERVS